MNPKIHEVASLGGLAKAASRAAQVQSHVAGLPPLTDFETAKLWLRAVVELSAAGHLSGSQAGAAARAVEIWVRTEQALTERNRFRALESQVEELERQLADKRRAGADPAE